MSRFLSRLKTPTGITSTIVSLLVGTIFLKLGLWQLSRADEKNSIVAAHESATGLPPLTSLHDDIDSVLYRRVELTGKFDFNRQFLLDNRVVEGQAGFEVITPFWLDDNQYVLVNLGWIGHAGDRQVNLVAPESPNAQMKLKGIIAAPSKGLVLADTGTQSSQTQWPFILQFIDYETIAAKLDKIPVFNAIVVAAEGQAGGYTYNFKPVASGARKHLGYAFQWFAMLFALAFIYLYLMVFKQTDE